MTLMRYIFALLITYQLDLYLSTLRGCCYKVLKAACRL